MAYGSDIKNSEKIKNVSILDLAPTILHLMNIPVPRDMDGRVLNEIFKEDSECAKKEIVYQEGEDEKERITERVRKLKATARV